MKNTLILLSQVTLGLGLLIVEPSLSDRKVWAAPSTNAPLPNLDRRFNLRQNPGAQAMQAAGVTPRVTAQVTAEALLRERVPGVQIDRHLIHGSPKWIVSRAGFLTGSAGQGGALAGARVPLQSAAPGDPMRVVYAFVDEFSGLFGHDAALLQGTPVARDCVSPHGGLRTIAWRQRHLDIEVADAVFLANVSEDGELVNVASQFIADPATAAGAGRTTGADPATPLLSAEQALRLALEHLGEDDFQAELVRTQEPVGAERRQRFASRAIKREAHLRLVWLPLNEAELRLCWNIAVKPRSRGEVYRLILDAATGELLVRRCQTLDISNASYRVYTSDSPTPFSPGYSEPGDPTQPASVSRSLITWGAANTSASPNGWINEGVNETRGNNVDASTDINGDDVLDLPRPAGSPNRVFDFALDLTKAPSAYRPAAVVNLFYWMNWAHDKLWELGFNEAAGNFQDNNFGRGGVAGDAIDAQAQDGEGTRNANFNYYDAADGQQAWVQMYLWPDASPDRDGDLDSEIMIHEYVHGLSGRLVGAGVGISDEQTHGMGEGWSDFYALALLSQPGDDPDAAYATGGYVLKDYKASNYPVFTDNYYYGIRQYPYSTDLSKDPLTFKDIDPAQDDPHDGVAASPRRGFSADEPHAQGTVWCSALWDARALLIHKYGYATGNHLILQLVTDGMKLGPANPNFLQARDAILAADVASSGGANKAELWTAFARRGMGVDASSPDASTTTGLIENFDLPDDMRVTAPTNLFVTGPEGGPFTASPRVFTVRHAGGPMSPALHFSVLTTPPLEANPQSAGLVPGGSCSVSVSLDANAVALYPQGVYPLNIIFSNQLSQVTVTHVFKLQIAPSGDAYAEVFDADFDLAWDRLTFTPENSTDYRVCRSSGTNLLVSTDAAVSLAVPSDGFVTMPLTGGQQVSLFGHSYSQVNVHEDGYVTFSSQPVANDGLLPERHFDEPRVSALFTPLFTDASSRISWQQLSDRCVATWDRVYESYVHLTNTFQIELFFDGVIRITMVYAPWYSVGITGLSAGGGMPPGFVEADFSAAPDCALLQLGLAVPTTMTEGGLFSRDNGRVSIPQRRRTDLTVTLISSDTTEVRVPHTVSIPAGQTSATFDVTPVDDALHDGTQLAYITASALGFEPAVARIRVEDNDAATLSVSLPARVAEGKSNFTGRVSCSVPADGVVSVALTSSLPKDFVVPPVVLIPGGQTSAVFQASAPENRRIDSPTATVTASVPNWVKGSDSVLILDNEPTNLVVRLPLALTEGAGTVLNQCSVSIGGTLTTNLTVSLWSSNRSDVLPPDTVVIRAGQTNAGFAVTVGDNAVLEGSRVVTLAATARGFKTASAGIFVMDNDQPPTPANPYPPDGATDWVLATPLSWDAAEGELLVNGNFETGDFTGWTIGGYGGGGFLINDGSLDPDSPDGAMPPLVGSFSARAVQQGNGKHTLSQDFYIPDGATNVVLAWRQEVRNHAGSFASNQCFAVELRRATDNTLLGELFSILPGDALSSGPTNLTADLMPWRGERVRLVFLEQDALGYLNVHLDDVSVTAGSAAPTTYDVYLGTDPTPGTAALLGSTSKASWPAVTLAGGLDYYWQVVARRGGATSPGPIWQFHTAGSSKSSTLLAANSTWRYNATGADLGISWRSRSYADTKWPRGRAPLGFGSSETTTIGYATNDYITFYFRAECSLDDTNRLGLMSAFLQRDDGAVVYVNGVEAFRDNMPSGRLTYLTQASSIVSRGDETNAVCGLIDPALFVEGTNVIAVEVHQRRNLVPVPGPSPDLFFDLALIARTNTGNLPPRSVAWTAPADFSVARAPTNLVLRATVQDDNLVGMRVGFFADGVLVGEAASSPFTQAWSNAPMGLHTLVAVATDSGGLSATSAPLHVLVAPGNPGQSLITLVASGDVWRYRDNGFDPGPDWTSLKYREPFDRSWKGGPSQLGYGDGDEATELAVPPDRARKPITAYFRRQFRNDLDVTAAQLRVLRDDGIVVYLNGREVFRDNMPGGLIRSNTLALTSVTGEAENTWITKALSPAQFVKGANVVAAEVHQVSATSPDLSFDLELAVVGNVPPAVALTAPAHQSQFFEPSELQLTATASDIYGGVAQVQFLADGALLGTAAAAPYQFTWSSPPAGVHQITAVAMDNLGASNASAPAQVTITAPVSLAMEPAGDQVLLWWPDSAPGYRLLTAPSLEPPVIWEWDTNAVVQTGGRFQVLLAPADAQRFFRLRIAD